MNENLQKALTSFIKSRSSGVKLEEGKSYRTEDGDVIKVHKNNLPHYCFSATHVNGVKHDCFGEKWTSEGIAYHDDCGYNFVG